MNENIKNNNRQELAIENPIYRQIESISSNALLKKEIEKTYEKRKLEIYNIKNPEISYEDLLLIGRNSLEKEIIVKKTIGLFNLNDSELIYSFFKKGWSKIESDIKNHKKTNNPFQVIKYISKFALKNSNDFFYDIIALFYFIEKYDIPILIKEGKEEFFLQDILLAFKYNKRDFNNVKISKEDKHKKISTKAKQELFGKYPNGLTGKDYYDWANDLDYGMANFTIDEYGLCDMDNVAHDIRITNKDIDRVIEIGVSSVLSGNMEQEEILDFIITSIRVMFLQRSFIKAKKIFFNQFEDIVEKDNITEKQKDTIRQLEHSANLLKSENENLRNEYKTGIERELIRLEKENKKLFNENEILRENLEIAESNIDLLQSDVFNENKDAEYSDVDLSKYNLVVIGGNVTLNERFDNIRYYSGQDVRFDLNVLKSANIVFLNVSIMSHAASYRTVGYLRKNNIKYYYINSKSEESLENEIKHLIKKAYSEE